MQNLWVKIISKYKLFSRWFVSVPCIQQEYYTPLVPFGNTKKRKSYMGSYMFYWNEKAIIIHMCIYLIYFY